LRANGPAHPKRCLSLFPAFSPGRFCRLIAWMAGGFVVERAKIPQYIVPDLTGFEVRALSHAHARTHAHPHARTRARARTHTHTHHN
jgi:hypothetical protein